MIIEKQGISKGRRITGWVLVGLLTALLIMSAVMKLIGGEQVAATFAKYGLEGRAILIGVEELISAILFVIPMTSSLGVLLLSAHMGGAIATHMEHGEPFVMPAVILALLWFAQWLRNPAIFASFRRTPSTTG
jgi:sorbitol-specific phosphotransferase system component IIC